MQWSRIRSHRMTGYILIRVLVLEDWVFALHLCGQYFFVDSEAYVIDLR